MICPLTHLVSVHILHLFWKPCCTEYGFVSTEAQNGQRLTLYRDFAVCSYHSLLTLQIASVCYSSDLNGIISAASNPVLDFK